MSDTTDALESLVTSEGWRLFMEHVRAEWANAGYGRKVKQALTEARARQEDAAVAVDRVDYANDQIGDVIGWPKQELARLKRQEAEPEEAAVRTRDSLSTMAIASMNRRGSL
jgi:hypothetical protein